MYRGCVADRYTVFSFCPSQALLCRYNLVDEPINLTLRERASFYRQVHRFSLAQSFASLAKSFVDRQGCWRRTGLPGKHFFDYPCYVIDCLTRQRERILTDDHHLLIPDCKVQSNRRVSPASELFQLSRQRARLFGSPIGHFPRSRTR